MKFHIYFDRLTVVRPQLLLDVSRLLRIEVSFCRNDRRQGVKNRQVIPEAAAPKPDRGALEVRPIPARYSPDDHLLNT
jgi:hypothetical protein